MTRPVLMELEPGTMSPAQGRRHCQNPPCFEHHGPAHPPPRLLGGTSVSHTQRPPRLLVEGPTRLSHTRRARPSD